jgi:16S rRNA (cytidine1402-2'-O)-methyltransferase
VAKSPGRLEVIATPIGNLADLTPRARDALAEATLIAAEDTRHTQQLLAACGISRPMVSLHEHNEAQRAGELTQRMVDGDVIALVSDAGTPLLSDPGLLLVRAAAAAGVPVRALPGPSALTAALSVAGIVTARFVFEGFLPARAGERQARLRALEHEPRTLVFFEAPHRLQDMLRDLAETFGAQREAAVARELTKIHESTYRGTLGTLSAQAEEDTNMSRGELVVVVAGAPAVTDQPQRELLGRLLPLLLAELPPARAAAIAARVTGIERAVIYEQAIRMARP